MARPREEYGQGWEQGQEQLCLSPLHVWMASRIQVSIRLVPETKGPPHSLLFLRGLGGLGHDLRNTLFFPGHPLYASVSLSQVVARNWDISQVPCMPITGSHAWHLVGSELGQASDWAKADMGVAGRSNRKN